MFLSPSRERVEFLIVHILYAKSYTWHVGNGELDDTLTTFMKQVQQSEVIF